MTTLFYIGATGAFFAGALLIDTILDRLFW